MKITRPLKLMLIPGMLMSCAVESPDLVPCMCDGTEKTLGIFDCMCEPRTKKVKKRVAYIQNKPEEIKPNGDQLDAYSYLHLSRSQYAPVKLEFVDFRIPRGRSYEDYENKLGNYRFRIFGCRRFDKEVYLNQGRAMQKDMKFFDVFYETMNDYYPVVVDKSNHYYAYSDKAQAEYILTAEITDYFMNVCDEFDWNNVKKKNLRTGTSEITVTWRLMDLTKNKIYCKGVTTGYGEMKHGEANGETRLVERAFGDALSKLPEVECYNTEIAKRVSPEEIQTQLNIIAEQERRKNNFRNQYEREIQGVAMLQNCGSGNLDTSNVIDYTSVNSTEAARSNTAGNNIVNNNSETQVSRIEDAGNIFAGGKEVRGYIDDNGNFIIDERPIDENGNIITQNSSRTTTTSTRTNSTVNNVIRGYIDDNGNFIADNGNITQHSGNVVTGYIDEHGNFIPDNGKVIENSSIAGSGYIKRRRLVEASGTFVTGYADESGNFIPYKGEITELGDQIVIGYLDENGIFIQGDPQLIENGETIVVGYLDEKGNFVPYESKIDENGGTIVAGYIDENGIFVPYKGKIDENGGSMVAGYIDEKGIFVPYKGKIDENGGSMVAGYIDEKGIFVPYKGKVYENGGSMVAGYINEKGAFVPYDGKIDENGGTLIAGYINEKGIFIPHNGKIDENSGSMVAGYFNEKGIFVPYKGKINENGGSSISGYVNEKGIFIADNKKLTGTDGMEIAGYVDENGNYVSRQEIIERSGGSSRFSDGTERGLKPLMLSDNCKEVSLDECSSIKVNNGKITLIDDYWLDIPADAATPATAKADRSAAENMFAQSNNNFCIKNVKPYASMSPENIYKLRSSVVSVENAKGRKGAGLIISDQFLLTSADLMDKSQNRFKIKTIKGAEFGASAFRVNPNKNVALLILDEKTAYAPLPLNLTLPEVGKETYMTLGLLQEEGGENYLDNEGQVIGYRYTEEKGAEIIVNTYVQTQTLGSVLVDKNGNIIGLSHSGIRAAEGGDLFIPIETAFKSLGLDICGAKITAKRPAAVRTVEKPVAAAIDNNIGGRDPATMKRKERK